MGCTDWLLIFSIFRKSTKCKVGESQPGLSLDLIITAHLKPAPKTTHYMWQLNLFYNARWISHQPSAWCFKEKNESEDLWIIFSQIQWWVHMWLSQYAPPGHPCPHVRCQGLAHTALTHSPCQIPTINLDPSYKFIVFFLHPQQTLADQKINMTH